MRRIYRKSLNALVLVLFLSCFSTAQKQAMKIDYIVALNDTASQQFHITTDIKNINQPRLDLTLPSWDPGWYTVENYFKNVLRFDMFIPFFPK